MSDDPVFELERFSAAPVSGDVAVVEVDGRFAGDALNGSPPTLLVESARGDRVELPALAPVAGPDGRWHASFAVPADRLDGTSFALVLRDVLLDLPAPDTSAADGDRLVALARELNQLRRELDVARAAADGADERLAEQASEAEADKDRALTASAERMEAALREARERHAAELRRLQGEATAATDALARERARAEETEGQRDALAEELREARRTQKGTRADMEALRRERDGLERQLEAALKVIPKGREEDTAATRVAPVPEPGEPVESVRVIGRAGPRRIPPADALPPVDAELPEPPAILNWIVFGVMFVIFVVVVTLLLL